MQYCQTERLNLNLIKDYKQQYENEKKSDCDLYIYKKLLWQQIFEMSNGWEYCGGVVMLRYLVTYIWKIVWYICPQEVEI